MFCKYELQNDLSNEYEMHLSKKINEIYCAKNKFCISTTEFFFFKNLELITHIKEIEI